MRDMVKISTLKVLTEAETINTESFKCGGNLVHSDLQQKSVLMFRSERHRHFMVVRSGSYEMISVFLFYEHSTKNKSTKVTIETLIKYMKFKPSYLYT